MSEFNFLKDFEKQVERIDGVSSSSQPPLYWFSTGSYNLNRILSGSFYRGIPQGRVVDLAGPSSAGKSFLLGNIVKNAQDQGAYVLVLDSEDSLDDDFMTAIGVDVKNNYNYKSVSTIAHVTKVVSAFIKGYEKEYGKYNENAPKVLIGIDSLDMLLTDTEAEHFDKGVQKGDQGQRSKQLKQMLRTFVNGIKPLNISMVCTSQVYQNTDLLNGEGKWIVTNAVRYAMSQIVLLEKLKLRDKEDKKDVQGIRMKCEGYKTRFTKPYQNIVVEVPYDSGMNAYSGVLETLVSMGLVKQAGAWYSVPNTDIKFQSKNFEQYAASLLEIAETQLRDAVISVDVSDADVDTETESKEETRKRRQSKAADLSSEETAE